MAVVIESGAPDTATALALDSLGLSPPDVDPFTALPDRVVRCIGAFSGAIVALLWLAWLVGR